MTVCPMADVLASKNKGKLNAELKANLFSKKLATRMVFGMLRLKLCILDMRINLRSRNITMA